MIKTNDSSVMINDTFIEVDLGENGLDIVAIDSIKQIAQIGHCCEIHGSGIFLNISFDNSKQSRTFVVKLKEAMKNKIQ